MKCKSCQEDVPPKFTHAFAVNICPLCGQEIMDTKLQTILGELKSALGDAKDYMEAVEDWLLSNYSLKKIKPNEVLVDKIKLQTLEQKSANAHSFGQLPGNSPAAHVPSGPGAMVNRREDSDDVIVDEKPTSIFHQRAGVINQKKALDFIKGKTSTGAADPSEFEGVDEEYGEMDEPATGNQNPLSVNEQRAMANIFKGNDLGSTSQELELQKLKRLQAQSAVAGGGGGAFRRG